MESFKLHPQLEKDTIAIADLKLSTLLLMNDKRYPWLILVPKRAGARELVDLLPGDQKSLLDEINQVSRALQQFYTLDKLNIAALGNMVPQLHIHIIARFKTDEAWPKPVWGLGEAVKYGDGELNKIKNEISSAMQPLDV